MEYPSVSSAATNTFTVSGGTILKADFEVMGGKNTKPAIVCCSLTFGFDGASNTFFAGLSNDPLSVPGAAALAFVARRRRSR